MRIDPRHSGHHSSPLNVYCPHCNTPIKTWIYGMANCYHCGKPFDSTTAKKQYEPNKEG